MRQSAIMNEATIAKHRQTHHDRQKSHENISEIVLCALTCIYSRMPVLVINNITQQASNAIISVIHKKLIKIIVIAIKLIICSPP